MNSTSIFRNSYSLALSQGLPPFIALYVPRSQLQIIRDCSSGRVTLYTFIVKSFERETFSPFLLAVTVAETVYSPGRKPRGIVYSIHAIGFRPASTFQVPSETGINGSGYRLSSATSSSDGFPYANEYQCSVQRISFSQYTFGVIPMELLTVMSMFVSALPSASIKSWAVAASPPATRIVSSPSWSREPE